MFLNDIDSQFIASVNYFYTGDGLNKGEPLPLQFCLEEAIKTKVGLAKDLTTIISSAMKKRRAEYTSFAASLEENKASSSDNELELDLLKEDLMCIVCNGMDVGARNRLLECSDCHMLYHQECHTPIVTNLDTFDGWICQNCKDANKKMKMSVPSPTSAVTGKSSSSSKSSSHRHTSNGSGSSNYNKSTGSKSDKHSKSSSSKSSSSSSSSSKAASASSVPASRSNVIPNINIISADKRIQIMKKKAAKMQEKRKHSR